MDKDCPYYKQVSLLIRMLPVVATETVFALKGGTAINLFVRDFPRLSVDIDLAYLPLEPRDEALVNVRAALQRITDRINTQPDIRAAFQDNKADELRIVVSSPVATIKIEVSPVARGTLHSAEIMPVKESVEDEFGYAEIQVVSLPDLYGGKLCAAMDRQHPRDLFDVRMLLGSEGISREILVGFLTYTLSHPRPINEVMSPNWQPLKESVEDEFGYAEIQVVSLPDLYGGKLCAAMDRQHPRDLFDVRMLLGSEGISREILVGFLTYTLSHPRPINEVMSPNWQPLNEKFQAEFDGMTFEKVECEDLASVRPIMLIELQKHFTERDHAFLMSFKRGQPDWALFDYPNAADLPAIRWKLQNINKLAKNQAKH